MNVQCYFSIILKFKFNWKKKLFDSYKYYRIVKLIFRRTYRALHHFLEYLSKYLEKMLFFASFIRNEIRSNRKSFNLDVDCCCVHGNERKINFRFL